MTPSRVPLAVMVGEFVRSGNDPSAPAFASPKSSTFTVPSRVSATLPGFRSRWTMPLSCAAPRASVIWRAMARASFSGSGPRAIRSANVSPSTNSSTNARTPAVVLEAINRADVRMIEHRQHPSFALESGTTLGVRHERIGQQLDCDITVEPRVPRAIDLAHPTAADECLDLIDAEKLPNAH